MAKTYLATKEQLDTYNQTLQTIASQQAGLAALGANKQTKVVEPSRIRQTIEPDAGYSALASVVVEPVTTGIEVEKFILRDKNREPFSLELYGAIPNYGCFQQNKLQKVEGNLTNIGQYAFQGCSSLQEIDCRNSTSIGQSAFQGCSSLQIADCRNSTSIGQYGFYQCAALQAIDCRNVTSISPSAFNADSRLLLVDLTQNPSVCTLTNVNAFTSTNNTWIALVADNNMKSAYQSATNWSTYASHFKTVAEFEAEIGKTYDEYYLELFGHPRNEVAA